MEGFITGYCASISTQIVFNRSFNLFWHISDRARNDFLFVDFEYTQSLLLLAIMAAALLTNQAVFDDISLMKIEASRMLGLFLRFFVSLL